MGSIPLLAGKSPICVLHEYVQHVLKISPEYNYRELENPQEPYSCTVVLKGVEYGSGTGSSKKTAKLQAAKATMKVLIPHLYEKVRNVMNAIVTSSNAPLCVL